MPQNLIFRFQEKRDEGFKKPHATVVIIAENAL